MERFRAHLPHKRALYSSSILARIGRPRASKTQKMRGGKEKLYFILLLLVFLLRLKSSFSSPFHFRGDVPYVSNLDFLTPNATSTSSSSVLADGTLTLTGDHVTPFFNAIEPLSRAKRFSFSCSVFLFDDRDNYENGGALISRMSSPEHPAFALTIEPPSSSSISGNSAVKRSICGGTSLRLTA